MKYFFIISPQKSSKNAKLVKNKIKFRAFLVFCQFFIANHGTFIQFSGRVFSFPFGGGGPNFVDINS